MGISLFPEENKAMSNYGDIKKYHSEEVTQLK